METWKTIPGWPEYQVSDLGQVRRMGGQRNRWGILKQSWRGSKSGSGKPNKYLGVTLYRKLPVGSIKKSASVHRLVLLAHVGPPPSPEHVGNHKSGNRADCSLGNLEWATHAQNNQHAIDVLNRKIVRGAEHGSAKAVDCAAIIAAVTPDFGERKVAELFGISRWLVRQVLAGNHWSQQVEGE